MRAFIAIELPDGIRKQLASLQSELKKSRSDAKWVSPDLIHITLAFLGEIDEQNLQKVFDAAGKTAGAFSPFTACLSSVGAFPSLDSPRVVWTGFGEGADRVKEIAARLQLELCAQDIVLEEDREFKAHATLGRTRSSLNRKELARCLHEAAAKPFTEPSFPVNAITVFKSILSSQGPTYEPLLRAPLTAK